MKKLLSVLLIFSVIVFLPCCSSSRKDDSEEPLFTNHAEIVPGLFFERNSSTENSIFFAPEATSWSRKNIVENEMIFRYAYKDGYLVYHWNDLAVEILPSAPIRRVNQDDYSIIHDYITVYDCENDEYINYTTQADFRSFCEDKGINFEWVYQSWFVPEIIKIASYEIHDFESESVCDYVIKDGIIIYEGYISDINIDEKKFSFRLQVPHKNILEFPDTTENLFNISFDKSIGHKQVGILLYEDVYYDEYITEVIS